MISHGKDLKVFSGSSNKALAKAICKELSILLRRRKLRVHF